MEPSIDTAAFERARETAIPAALREALATTSAYLVGGAVRDALLGREIGDVDVAVDSELDPLLDRLGVPAHSHERFGTATVVVDGREVDIARTRRETYPRPGALPRVQPAPIRVDLARRDFTINAMAVPLLGPAELIDPYGGLEDLGSGLLRVIGPSSFRDDPTRALRAARYMARLGFQLEAGTEELLREADLGTVSADRVNADLFRIAAEPEAVRGLLLLEEWDILELGEQRRSLLERVAELAPVEPWRTLVDRAELLLDVATAPEQRLEAARELCDAARSPISNSELFELACEHDDRLLAIARAFGATRLDEHVSEWRRVRLVIGGEELIEAGVPAGPDRGRGLRAAISARIDGEIEADPEAELRIALEAIGHRGQR